LLHRLIEQDQHLDPQDAKGSERFKRSVAIMKMIISHDPETMLVCNLPGNLPHEIAPLSAVGEWLGAQHQAWVAARDRKALSAVAKVARRAPSVPLKM
jgi:hypothetical protein